MFLYILLLLIVLYVLLGKSGEKGAEIDQEPANKRRCSGTSDIALCFAATIALTERGGILWLVFVS